MDELDEVEVGLVGVIEAGVLAIESAIPTADQIRADIQDRRTFIGGSDAPVILGLSSWKSRYELWQEKTGEKEPDDLSEVERVRWGTVLEAVVAEEYMRRTGKRVRRINQRQVSKDHAWMVAQIDRRIVGGGLLEIKTTDGANGSEWGEEGTAEIPAHYYAQVQHQLAVMRESFAEVAVLIGGNRMRLYLVPRDDTFIDDMIAAESEFWMGVQARVPPEPITLDEAALRWSKAKGEPVIGTQIHAALRDEALLVQEEIKRLTDRLDTIKLELENAMRDLGDTLMVDGAAVATWKAQSRKSLDEKALRAAHPEIPYGDFERESSYRVLRLSKGKK